MDSRDRKIEWGRLFIRAAPLFVFFFVGIFGGAFILHPDGGLPPQWDPFAPLSVTDPVTPLTTWKLERTAASPELCYAALEDYAEIADREPILSSNENCGAENAVSIRALGDTRLNVETACATALHLSMWEHHVVQPAAEFHLGARVERILDQGSFNCRPIRTSSGSSTRWSTHAKALAIDVRGFRFSDGSETTLLQDYFELNETAFFLEDIRDGACEWFGVVLGPDYNALHADHFHLQVEGWGTCR